MKKKWKKSINPLKKGKKNNRTREGNNSNNSRLKNLIKKINKTQTEGVLEMETLGKQIATIDVSLAYRIQEMEEKSKLSKRKSENIHINKIRNRKRAITTDTEEIQIVISSYLKNLYSRKLENLK